MMSLQALLDGEVAAGSARAVPGSRAEREWRAFQLDAGEAAAELAISVRQALNALR